MFGLFKKPAPIILPKPTQHQLLARGASDFMDGMEDRNEITASDLADLFRMVEKMQKRAHRGHNKETLQRVSNVLRHLYVYSNGGSIKVQDGSITATKLKVHDAVTP